MNVASKIVLSLTVTMAFVHSLYGHDLPLTMGGGLLENQCHIPTVRALNDFLAGAPSDKTLFSLTGVVTHCSNKSFVLLDETGAVEILHLHEPRPQTGDFIRITGWASVLNDFNPAIWDDHTITTLGRAPIPPPLKVPLGKLAPISHNRRTIVTTATVIDAFPDEIDVRYVIILLKDGPKTLPVSLPREALSVAEARQLIGHPISATGTYHRAIEGGRKYAGPTLIVESRDDLHLIGGSTNVQSSVPPLEHHRYRTPEEIAALDIRSAVGTVIAAWPRRLILRRDEGDLINVRLAEGEKLPGWGSHVTIIGFPETDLFRLGLARARIQPDTKPASAGTEPTATDIASIVRFENGSHIVCADDHGRSYRFRGILSESHSRSDDSRTVRLTDGSHSLTVDISAAPGALSGIEDGCEIELVGVCRIDSDPYSLYDVLPRIRGLTVVLDPRQPIVVLSRPPWLTRGRLLSFLALMTAALVGILVWNRALDRRANRKTRELLKEQLRHAATELKVDERTRIAVELHDTLSQNLAGVAYQITASERTFTADPATSYTCLKSACRILSSCRRELRNCLLDLRQDTLDEKDVAAAIRRTLANVSKDVSLSVRFSVPRTRLHDATMHAILCIIRELTANAIQHGQATEVNIVGDIDDSTLKFSVMDNGCGFDPTVRPRSADGHFGIDGIRDRIRRLGGTFELNSTIGKGTCATLSIRLSSPSGDNHGETSD